MEEPKQLATDKEDKKKIAINLANARSTGVGIVIVAGALATVALVSALSVGRRLMKSGNRSRSHQKGHADTPENFIAENVDTSKDEGEALRLSPPDSFPEFHQNLSNEAAKTSMTEIDNRSIFSESFFPEEKQIFGPHSAKGDLICDDKEIILRGSFQGSDGSKQCNGSVVKTEEFLLPVVANQKLFQAEIGKEDTYGGEIKIVEEKITDIPDVHHSVEEDSQLMQVNDDQTVGEAKCIEAAETAKANQSALVILQSCEKQESTLIDHDLDNNRCCLPAKSSVSIDQGCMAQPLHNSSLCKGEILKISCGEGSQAFEKVEISEAWEALNTVHLNKDQTNTMLLMMEEKEEKCNEHEVWPISENAEQLNRDETLEAAYADESKVNGVILMSEEEEKICSHDGLLIVQTVEELKSDEKLDHNQVDEGNGGLLIVSTVDVFKRDEKQEAEQVDGGYSRVPINSGEEEEKGDQHDGSLTAENARVLEEDKSLEPLQVKEKTEIVMLGEAIDAPHDDENDTAGEAARSVNAIDSLSSSNLEKQLTEGLENLPIYSQEVSPVADVVTSEKVESEIWAAQDPNHFMEAHGAPSRFELGSRMESNLKEIEQLVEASKIKKETLPSEAATEESEDGVKESDINPLKESIGNILKEIEDTPATTEADDVGVTSEMERSEEGSIDDQSDEANIRDKLEESSEGTGDSSAEYNSEPIWPAEALKELTTDLKELKLDGQKDKQQAEENKTLQAEEKLQLNEVEDRGISTESHQNMNESKDSSKSTFLEKYMLELAEQNDQETNLRKPRILCLTWRLMLLLWPFCLWYFGLPFLKISLILILVILLSKIQGS